jgi:hypothetical protein
MVGAVENLVILRGLSALVATVFFFCNLYAVRHSVVSLVLPRRVANIEIGEEVPSRYLLFAVIGMSLLFGALLAFPQDDWAALALVRSGQPFRESDPYFEYDLGFWTYWLPFETSLHVWALIALLAATTVVVFLYALTPSLRWERGTLHVSGYVRRHLSLLGALLIFLLHGATGSTDWDCSSTARALVVRSRRRTGRSECRRTSCSRSQQAPRLCSWGGHLDRSDAHRVRHRHGGARTVARARQFLPPLALRLADPSEPDSRESAYLATRALYTRRAYAVDRVVTSSRNHTSRCAAIHSRIGVGVIAVGCHCHKRAVGTTPPGNRERCDRVGIRQRGTGRHRGATADGAGCGRPVHVLDDHTRARVVRR